MNEPGPILTLNQLIESRSDAIIFRCISGSHAYGTAGPASDRDERGIFILPAAAYLKLAEPPAQVADARGDTVFYSLRRFVQLAAGANPNLIELLFMPDDCILTSAPCMRRILDQRELFVTRRAYESHVAYALAQIKKARGQNKWINNPQPEAPPTRADFCWFLAWRPDSADPSAAPLRPIHLSGSGVNPAHCHAAALEHAPGIYRLYHYGPEAKGVFRQGCVVCESIPQSDEATHCIGLLIYNEPAYARAVRDHQNYWNWRRQRNPARWETQESGQMDYDAKNLMHTFRLLISAEHIFREGAPLVRVAGEDRDFLLSIRAGAFGYDTLIRMAEQRVARLEELHRRSSLPESPDPADIERLLADVTTQWEAGHA